MKWIADNTGRLPKRPYYEAVEIEHRCETIIQEFCTRRHGRETCLPAGVPDYDLQTDWPGTGDHSHGGVQYYCTTPPLRVDTK